MAEAPPPSIVVPVYNGAATVGELVGALRALEIEGGLEIVLVVDGSPDNSLDVCKELAARARRAGHRAEPQPQFRRAQRGDGRACAARAAPTPSPWTTTCRTRRPRSKRLFEHARDGGYDAVYTYYAEKKHAAWRNLGSRFTNWCADRLIDKPQGPLSLELPLHLGLRARAHRGELRGALSLCRRAGLPGDAECRPPAGRAPAAQRGPLELHAAPAVPAVAVDVPQFLGDAAAARHPVRPGLRRAGRIGCGHRHRRGDRLRQAAAGLGVADGGGAGAGRRAARRGRADRRVSRPHVPRRQPQAAVSGARGLPAAAPAGSRSSGRRSTRGRRASPTASRPQPEPER